METKEENTAVEIAILKSGLPVNKNRYDAEKNYRMAVKIVSSMLNAGLISKEEYAVFDTKLRDKFRPISCEIL